MLISLVPRPSPAPDFDHLQYAKTEPDFAYCKQSKTGAGLGTRLMLIAVKRTSLSGAARFGLEYR